jgi:hypothetical protein
MAEPVSLPEAFASDRESHEFLARVKKKASKNFRRTSAECLRNAGQLAFYLHALGRDEEALAVCRFLGQVQFDGNFNRWSPLETVLCLQARLARAQGNAEEAAESVRRVREAGFVAARLEGRLLDTEPAERAARDGDKARERDFRLHVLDEVCFMSELGGSEAYPVATLERLHQETVERLRTLLGPA